jgi:hypothetical protein
VKIWRESCAPLSAVHKSLRVGEVGGAQEEGGAAALHDMRREETRVHVDDIDVANDLRHLHK